MATELIARIEAATGADWRLDVSLSEHYYPGDRDMHRAAMEGRWAPTKSIDAALTLVPDKYRDDWCAGSFLGGYGAYLGPDWRDVGLSDVSAYAATPALAICAAALKARGGEG